MQPFRQKLHEMASALRRLSGAPTSIAGPLNVPQPPTGESIIAWHAATAAELPPQEERGAIDLVFGAAGTVPVVTLGESLPKGTRAGVVLRAASDQPLGDGFAPVAPSGSLRAALNLPQPAPLPASARSAFPVPQPHVTL